MKIHRLDHFHIYAVDPEGSARYYTEVFGAETIGNARSSYGGAVHFLRLGGVALVLAPYPPGVEAGTPPAYRDGTYQHGYGIAHFGLHVDGLEEAVEFVRRRGGTILSEPRENAGLRFAYIAAPDGVIVELLEHHGQWSSLLGPPTGVTVAPPWGND